jgi:hypothetical protein
MKGCHPELPFTSHKRGIAFQLPQGGIAEREQLHKNDETWRSVFQTAAKDLVATVMKALKS